jgi:hypothetical protein
MPKHLALDIRQKARCASSRGILRSIFRFDGAGANLRLRQVFRGTLIGSRRHLFKWALLSSGMMKGSPNVFGLCSAFQLSSLCAPNEWPHFVQEPRRKSSSSTAKLYR